MPKRRRHLPGRYQPKPKPELGPNFTGTKPLTVFQGEDGKWGAKDGDGNIVIEPIYRMGQREEDRANNNYILGNGFEVILVTPDDWDLLAFSAGDL